MTSQNNSPADLKELLAIIKPGLTPVFRDNSISFAYLAGSWAREQQGWWSDIDVFVSCPTYQDLSTNEKLHLIVELNVKANETTSLNQLEIRVLEKQSLHTQFRIIKEGILIYERSNSERTGFIEKLLHSYYDHVIWFKKYLAQSLKAVDG